MSKSCLNSKEERRERTATSSSVTKSGTRRENAFFFRIAIGREANTFSENCSSFLRSRPGRVKSAEITQRAPGAPSLPPWLAQTERSHAGLGNRGWAGCHLRRGSWRGAPAAYRGTDFLSCRAKA